MYNQKAKGKGSISGYPCWLVVYFTTFEEGGVDSTRSG
jgi:hypothetical protein